MSTAYRPIGTGRIGRKQLARIVKAQGWTAEPGKHDPERTVMVYTGSGVVDVWFGKRCIRQIERWGGNGQAVDEFLDHLHELGVSFIDEHDDNF